MLHPLAIGLVRLILFLLPFLCSAGFPCCLSAAAPLLAALQLLCGCGSVFVQLLSEGWQLVATFYPLAV